MILFLTSSPCVAGEAALNPVNGFVDALREALPEGPRCLFVCSDPDSPELTDHFAEDMAGAFAEAGMEFSEMAVCDGRNAEDAPWLVAESDFIILAGGHVPTQNAFFRRIGLRELLQGYEGVVMGISAGTMNCADEVYAQPELEGESVDPDYARFLPGLGLTELEIVPHYQETKDNMIDGQLLYEDVTLPDSMGRCFLALVDGSYVLCCGGETELRGEAYAIGDGELRQISGEGDCIPL